MITLDVSTVSMLSAKIHKADPETTRTFVNTIHFHLPYFANGPANRAATALPPVVNDCINVY